MSTGKNEKKYFYSNNDKINGPFNFNELKDENIKRSSLVWYHGLESWLPITEVIELREIVNRIPPPLPKIENKNEKKSNAVSKEEAESTGAYKNTKSSGNSHFYFPQNTSDIIEKENSKDYLNNNKLFSIENRAIPQTGENIPFLLNNLSTESYTFAFNVQNFEATDELFLKDNYTGELIPIQLGESQIEFTADAPNPLVINDENLTDISNQITGALASNPEFIVLVESFGLPAQAAPQVAGLLGATYGQARQATEEELLVLPSSSIIGTVNTDRVAFLVSQGLPQELAGQFSAEGITLPLEDKWVLLPEEQDEIAAATAQFNQVISAVASSSGFALLDANALLDQIASSGVATNDLILTSSLVTGGAFSLDGVHPTSRGYALIANEMLKAIDVTYGSNFEASGNLVDVSSYNTTYSPSLLE